MKRIGIFLSILVACLLSENTFSRTKHADVPSIYGMSNLTYELNRIVQSVGPNASVGIEIKSMKHGDMLYRFNNQELFIPASILKVVTAQAALIYLGANYKFSTTLLTDAKRIHNGVLYGNLYLVHSGDPSLTYENIAGLISALKTRQIQKINGNVYIDNTAYDQDNVNSGWNIKDKNYCFSAPINASIINHNCLSFAMLPGKFAGQYASVVPNPKHYYAIQNSVITKPARTKACGVHLDENIDSSFSLTGCLSKGASAYGVSTVINNILAYNKSMIRYLLKHQGITVSGLITSGTAPAHIPALAIHESQPLITLINEMLKKSDNIVAGSLFKKVGAMYSRQPGSWANASNAVSQILAQQAGVNTYGMSVQDGSGLSLYNKISPQQMMQILDFAFHHYSTNYAFVAALPIAGVDGTLKYRLRNVPYKIRAKTGSLSKTGVVALAGYALTQDKEPVAFVVMVNGHNGLSWKYREFEDRIATVLTKYSRG